MPRLLFVTTVFPFPVRGGITQKTSHYLELLSRHYEVTLVSFIPPHEHPGPDDLRTAESYCVEVHTVPQQRRNALRSLISGKPPFTSRFESREAARLVGRLSRSRPFDVAHFDCIGSLQARDALEGDGTVTVASLNDSYALMVDGAPRRGAKQRVGRAVNAWLTREYERRTFPKFDQVHFVSEVDCDYVRNYVDPARIRYVPLGIRVPPVAPGGVPRQPTIIYVAGLSRLHGRSISDFIRDSLPAVRRAVPDVRLLVVGANPPPSVLSAAEQDPSIEVTGWVDDLLPFYHRASIALSLNPLTGGMQTKVLQAMAMGKAVVGLKQNFVAISEAVPGTHFLHAASPAELIQPLTRLLLDPVRTLEIGSAARDLIARRYSWEHVIERYRATISGAHTASASAH